MMAKSAIMKGRSSISSPSMRVAKFRVGRNEHRPRESSGSKHTSDGFDRQAIIRLG
eukprot:CAMPEP_0197189800 /NCGR_PEP_ID=MMETSP1423-20130617/20406_1 /TAXON_ID=476441 /ORGANISM="Pseudo-nitzschia heimii, Strain UNC1101" /LENGTH=55 /DNA_ID=CAMNT_0042642015 /DNA_START=268 /DNA_END=435 /DNA_ORIENTATION=-